MPEQLRDNYGRKLDYVRLAITDRCNLRCFYCMPSCGIKFVERDELLSYEELERLIGILGGMGVHKVRITGGEPLVRRGAMEFMERIPKISGVQSLHLTTNGTLTLPHIPRLAQLGLASVNISLDALDEDRFFKITKRKGLQAVLESVSRFADAGIPTKLNMVVMAGYNDEDISAMAALARDRDLEIRFIEEMPFNGKSHEHQLYWDHRKLRDHLFAHFPELRAKDREANSTSQMYSAPKWQGSVGIIAAFSRTFCGTCNRLRITPTGMLKTCLYDDGVLDLREILRNGSSDAQIEQAIRTAAAHKPKDGFEAELNRTSHAVSESMATIGG
ncbi:MAG: GTP 3',8-cyclase MoaA [Flavobacteriales bacterium]|nr:GTP 3',8-cyclase MoaA [Flavobacteriales bacterium]